MRAATFHSLCISGRGNLVGWTFRALQRCFQLGQIINGRHLFSIPRERAWLQLGPGEEAEAEAAVWQEGSSAGAVLWSRCRGGGCATAVLACKTVITTSDKMLFSVFSQSLEADCMLLLVLYMKANYVWF